MPDQYASNKPPSPKISDRIRAAVTASGKRRRAIGRAVGISDSMMSRFMNRGMGLSTDRLDALAGYLDLELVARKAGV